MIIQSIYKRKCISINYNFINKLLIIINRNNYIESIQSVHNAGKSNDELGLFKAPLDMYAFLDGERYNPDLYKAKTYEGNSILLHLFS